MWEPPQERRHHDWASSEAVGAVGKAFEEPAGTPQRTEELRKAQVFAMIHLADEVQMLRGTVKALGDLGYQIWLQTRGSVD